MDAMIFVYTLPVLLGILAIVVLAWVVYDAKKQHQTAVINLNVVADKLTIKTLREFKTDTIPTQELRSFVFTQYVILCADVGFPREYITQVMHMVEGRIIGGAYLTLEPETIDNNFLFSNDEEELNVDNE